MKILIGALLAESNAYVKQDCEIQDFTILKGPGMADKLYISELARENDVELIPSLHASCMAAGVVDFDTFDYLRKKFIQAVKEHEHELDGIYLFLHGASHVRGLPGGSGDHYLLNEIRKVVGPYMPIAVLCDPHGNLAQDYVDQCTILRTFRHSPHSDRDVASQTVFRCLLDVLKDRRPIHPVYRKVPILLGGERCVSADEPLCSINKLLDEIEADPRILCCSYHIGYLRHDSEHCGAGIVVVPDRPEDTEYAKQKADEIYDFVWARHQQFHFTGNASEPEEALRVMLEFDGSPCFLSDSGDNVTAGAPGVNTTMLKQVLALNDFHNKSILFAAICDPQLCATVLANKKAGEPVTLTLGANLDAHSAPVSISGTVISTGNLHRRYGDEAVAGQCWTVKLDNVPVSVVIASAAVSFSEREQYEKANVDLDGYDLIIVKQGYLYPELKAMAKHYVMALTDGACMQRTEKLIYKKVSRPIYPLDEI